METGIRLPKFNNKTGTLTAYALGCGYIEAKGNTATQEVRLWRAHGTYHVRMYDWIEHRRVFWETFRLLSDARTCYQKTKILPY